MSHFWIWKTDKGLHKGQMSKTEECCSLKAHNLSSFGSIHMERNINHRNHRCCSSAAFICYQQSLGNSRVFLICFFCCFFLSLSQTVDLTQFLKIPLQEGRRTRELEILVSFQLAGRRRWRQRARWLLLWPQSLVWSGLPDVEGPCPCGLSSWACGWPQKHIGQGRGNHGRKLRPAKATSSTRAATFYLSLPLGEAVHWYNMAVLGKVHFLTRWNHTLLKIRFEFAPSQGMSVCNHTTWPW